MFLKLDIEDQGGGVPRGTTMVGAEREKIFKNEDSRSLEMAILESYKPLFDRSLGSLIEPKWIKTLIKI